MSTPTPDPLAVQIAQCIDLLAKFVVPIYVVENRRPKLLGTGFFLQQNDAVILVSAAHVLRQASNSEPIYAYRTPSDIIRIGGRRFLSDPNTIDLGFIITSGIELPWFEVEKFACRASYLRPSRLPRALRHFAIVGYPETKNRVDPRDRTIPARAYAYHAHSIPDEEYAKHGLDPADNIALPMDLRVGIDPQGNHVNFPKPLGMSGCPIWELFDESEEPVASRRFPLAGVATNYRSQAKIVYGTDIQHLLDRIATAA